MINPRSRRPTVQPLAPLGVGVGSCHSCSITRSGPHHRPRTCRPPGAPRSCQLSEVARVERWKMLWVGIKGLKGQHPPRSPQPSKGQERDGESKRLQCLSLPCLNCSEGLQT